MGPLFEGIPVFYTYNCPSHQGKNWEFYFILEHKVKDTLIFFFFYVVLVFVFVQEIANLEFRKCCLIG